MPQNVWASPSCTTPTSLWSVSTTLPFCPFAVLVDPHGTVRHVHAGYRAEDAMTYADELAALILE